MKKMTREEFGEAVREAMRANVTPGDPCGCCGITEMEGFDDAVAQMISVVFEDDPTTD